MRKPPDGFIRVKRSFTWKSMQTEDGTKHAPNTWKVAMKYMPETI